MGEYGIVEAFRDTFYAAQTLFTHGADHMPHGKAIEIRETLADASAVLSDALRSRSSASREFCVHSATVEGCPSCAARLKEHGATDATGDEPHPASAVAVWQRAEAENVSGEPLCFGCLHERWQHLAGVPGSWGRCTLCDCGCYSPPELNVGSPVEKDMPCKHERLSGNTCRDCGMHLWDAPTDVGHAVDVTNRDREWWKAGWDAGQKAATEATANDHHDCDETDFMLEYLYEALGAAADDIWAMGVDAWKAKVAPTSQERAE